MLHAFMIIIIHTYLYNALFTLCSNLKKTVRPLLNTHRFYTEKMNVFLTLLWNQPSGYFVVVHSTI